jgi:hypothetical protein
VCGCFFHNITVLVEEPVKRTVLPAAGVIVESILYFFLRP